MEQFWEGLSDKEISDMLLSEPYSDNEEKEKRALKEVFAFLIPRYDSLTLFTFSVAFLLLLLINDRMLNELKEALTSDFARPYAVPTISALIMSVPGMILSIFNIFFKRKKYQFEKYLMLIFAVVVSGGTGIYAGITMLETQLGWLIIFPLWNIINGVLLLLLFRTGIVDADCIIDDTATLIQIASSFISIVVLLFLCHYIFKLHWAVTYSICVCYTMSFHNALQDVLGKNTTKS